MSLTVVLDTAGLSPADLAARAILVADAALAKPLFAASAAKFTALKTAAQALLAAETGISNAQAAVASAVSTRDASVAPVSAAFDLVATAVGETPAVTEADIRAISLRTPGPVTSRPVPARVEGLALSYGDEPGEVDGHCHSQRKIADFYQTRFTTTDPTLPATVWTSGAPGTKSSFTLTNLPSGSMVWVQMRATNSQGDGPWSDPACIRVP